MDSGYMTIFDRTDKLFDFSDTVWYVYLCTCWEDPTYPVTPSFLAFSLNPKNQVPHPLSFSPSFVHLYPTETNIWLLERALNLYDLTTKLNFHLGYSPSLYQHHNYTYVHVHSQFISSSCRLLRTNLLSIIAVRLTRLPRWIVWKQ